MTPVKTFPAVVLLLGSAAWAGNTQIDLARQIEETSVTIDQGYFDTGEGVGWTFFPPLNYRREMDVEGCEITARTFTIRSPAQTEQVILEITFDLARTQIPDPNVPIGSVYAYYGNAKTDEPNGTALFELRFLPPYEPLIWSKTSDHEQEQQVTFTRFLMEPVSGETQPRHLLALLKKYQAQYCNFTG